LHLPVLLPETIDNLVTDIEGIYVDCTLGGGGHFEYLIGKLAPNALVIGLDKDAETLEQTRQKLPQDNVILIKSDFRHLMKVLAEIGIYKVDGIVVDLGVSSFQLDQAVRGFSFHNDAPLDMRMDREQILSARDIVNDFSEDEISRILFSYGEETHARKISRAIINYRLTKPIDSTLELAEIIKNAVPSKYRRDKHPARKSFQALRIFVNQELEALQELLPQAIDLLKPGGRLAVISFHSLEDRLVKKFLAEKALDCVCPPDFPVCVCDHRSQVRLVNRKPIIPSPEECAVNPRARSAKLRIAERI
jgi:16S rRNA (cytosine1402-N4)-methyltransferase